MHLQQTSHNYKVYKTQLYTLQLAAHLTLTFNIYMTKHTYYPYRHITYLSTMMINRLIQATTSSNNTLEASLTQRHTLAQLGINKSPFLSYLHKVDASHTPSPPCVLCNTPWHHRPLHLRGHTADGSVEEPYAGGTTARTVWQMDDGLFLTGEKE